jgi:hypothetical protein
MTLLPDKYTVAQNNNNMYDKYFGSFGFHLSILQYYECQHTAILFYNITKNSELHPDGFILFKAPCNHFFYKAGQSLCEYFKFTPEELEGRLSKFVNHHKSKTEYMESADKFKGKMYASYDVGKRTMFIQDKEAVDEFIEFLKIRDEITDFEI